MISINKVNAYSFRKESHRSMFDNGERWYFLEWKITLQHSQSFHLSVFSVNMIIAMQWKEVNDESTKKFFSWFSEGRKRTVKTYLSFYIWIQEENTIRNERLNLQFCLKIWWLNGTTCFPNHNALQTKEYLWSSFFKT